MRGEFSFNGVQIGVAEAAGADFDAHLAGAGNRDRQVGLAKGVFFDRTRVLEN